MGQFLPPPPPQLGIMRSIALAFLLIALMVALVGINPSPAAAQSTTDYDDDDDGLIDVTTLAQLNAIRWDLDGDGDMVAGDAANYLLAFPNRDTAAASRMGCPSGTCTGYELRADLDFDTDDDGDVDSSDTYPSWTPIGASIRYSAEFKGNNHTISNLTISGSVITFYRVGLFGGLSTTGSISGVGLVDVNINIPSSTYSRRPIRTGALVGYNQGTVRSSYSTGSVSVTTTSTNNAALLFTGGLVGTIDAGTVAASWSSADVSASAHSSCVSGGLVGGTTTNGGYIIASYAAGSVSDSCATTSVAGGLMALGGAGSGLTYSISASYATGPASTNGTAIGLAAIGSSYTGTISDSYWDTGTSGIADDSDTTSPEGKTTSDLQSVLSYTGIYANWNVNVDGTTGNDDPWDFGTNMQYPRLKFDGMSQVAQGSLAMGTPGTNGDNPVVGQLAQVCLVAGPTQRAAGSGGVGSYKLWIWSKSTDGVSWTNITEDGGRSYEYTPVSGDVGSYLRACVALDSTLSAVDGAEEACVHPFAKVKASN